MRGAAAIIGIGEIAPTRHTDGVTTTGFLADVAHRAMRDAGAEPAQIDGLIVQNVADAPFMAASVIADYLGLQASFLEMVDLGGASAGVMIVRAAAAVASGLAENVLCLTAVPNERVAPRAAGMPSTAGAGYKNRTAQGEWDVPLGATGGTFAYAMLAQATLARSGVTADHLWQVVSTARSNAERNPAALFHAMPITRADYDASPLTCTPLHEADAITSCAGAAAVVVGRAGREPRGIGPRGIGPRGIGAPITILGAGEWHTHRGIATIPNLDESGNAIAARRAFAMAGIEPSTIDVACLYDAFSSLVPRALSESGFVAPADVGAWLSAHDIGIDGDLPINPFGGLLGAGHAGVAAGMSLVTGLVRQLQGRAEGCQVARHARGFVNGTGGEMSTNIALVLAREAP